MTKRQLCKIERQQERLAVSMYLNGKSMQQIKRATMRGEFKVCKPMPNWMIKGLAMTAMIRAGMIGR